MPFHQWYHEIALCGVNKVSMSITDLSNEGKVRRDRWMSFFEGYFGFMIKFVNPAIFTFILFNNLADDLAAPYSINEPAFHLIATGVVFIAVSIIVIPMFMCDYHEVFQHNVM